MKQHTHMRKSAVLGSLLLALLLLLNGCFIQPDRTVKDPLTTDVDTLPFENVQPLTTQTPTPSPIPAPSATEVTSSGWEDWSGGGNTAMPTRQPVVTSYQSAPPAPTQRPVVAAATPKDETLRFGDSNQEVQDMQRALQSLGYYNGSVDGKFANGTQTAVSEFQRANGLSVDGIAGARTLDRLYGTQAVSKPKATAAPTMAPIPTTTNYRFLQEGGSGSDVKKLQQRLKTLGYFQGSVNGNFSVDTKQAVMAFQQNNKLWVDGVAGADTQSMIYSPYAAAASDTVSSGYRTLKEGMNGSDVVRLQQKLSSLGYLATTPDGYYGAQTVSAVRAFQQNNALSVDGVAGSGTQKRLFSGKANAATGPAMGNATPMPQTGNGTLREGDIGDAVYRLQERLYDLGYYTGRIDGAYGSAVTGAVRQFQRKHGLDADGVAGASTQMKLYSTGAIPASGTVIDSSSSGQGLREGMVSDDVLAMQQWLSRLGYYTGTVDGSYGGGTTTAVRAFQAANGLNADGVAGQQTLQLLYSGQAVANPGMVMPGLPNMGSGLNPGGIEIASGTLRQGDSGALVSALQQRLKALGYFHQEVDGNYGSATLVAVQSFQRTNGLTVDGVAGMGTQVQLMSSAAITADGLGTISGARPNGLSTVNNRDRELVEQESGGALQVSLSGGGIATAIGGITYYSNGNAGGHVYARNSAGQEWEAVNEAVRFLHVMADGSMYYVATNDIVYNSLTGNRQVIASPGYVSKMSVYNGWIYYQLGNMLMRVRQGASPATVAGNINDFTVDVATGMLYVASDDGIFRVASDGSGIQSVSGAAARQVFLCGDGIYFRQSGSIFRLLNGTPALVIEAGSSWAGAYRDRLYYINGTQLYTCDTVGQNARVFDAGPAATVSFISGVAYIGSSSGGGVNRRVNVS